MKLPTFPFVCTRARGDCISPHVEPVDQDMMLAGEFIATDLFNDVS